MSSLPPNYSGNSTASRPQDRAVLQDGSQAGDEHPFPATHIQVTLPTACHSDHALSPKTPLHRAGEGYSFEPPHPSPQVIQCHSRMEGLPAQGCDPLAVACKGPAHLLPCAWVPQENLKDRSSPDVPPQPSPGPAQPSPAHQGCPPCPQRPRDPILAHPPGKGPQGACLVTLSAIYLAILAAGSQLLAIWGPGYAKDPVSMS